MRDFDPRAQCDQCRKPCDAYPACVKPEPAGRKDDAAKPRWSLLPSGVVSRVVAVLEFGAKKYSLDNWKNVPDARRRYYDAMLRHIESWWGGEHNDPETGFHHLAHAICCAMFALWLDENGEQR